MGLAVVDISAAADSAEVVGDAGLVEVVCNVVVIFLLMKSLLTPWLLEMSRKSYSTLMVWILSLELEIDRKMTLHRNRNKMI